MNLILVGIGGIFGGLARFILAKTVTQKLNSTFPLGTFIINLTGALLLGVLTGSNVNNKLYLLLGDGFLGAYTTFSTFMYEGFNLFQENEKMNAFIYILGTLLFGIIGYAAGFALTKIL